MTYKEWKAASRSTLTNNIVDTINFEKTNPHTVRTYKERMAAEEKKRNEIMAIKDTNERRKAISENMTLFE